MYNHCIQSLCTPLQYTVRELLESILGVRQGKTRPGQARQGTSIVKLDEDDGEERHLLADSQSADTLARARGRQAQAQAQAQATATATAESVQQTAVLAMLLPSQLPPPLDTISRVATATGKHYTHRISDDPVRQARTSPQAPLTAGKG